LLFPEKAERAVIFEAKVFAVPEKISVDYVAA
jgi:hypothetical protein